MFFKIKIKYKRLDYMESSDLLKYLEKRYGRTSKMNNGMKLNIKNMIEKQHKEEQLSLMYEMFHAAIESAKVPNDKARLFDKVITLFLTTTSSIFLAFVVFFLGAASRIPQINSSVDNLEALFKLGGQTFGLTFNLIAGIYLLFAVFVAWRSITEIKYKKRHFDYYVLLKEIVKHPKE